MVYLERKMMSGKLDHALEITIDRIIAMTKSICIVVAISSILTGNYKDDNYKIGVHEVNDDVCVYEYNNLSKPKTLVLVRKN